MQIDRVAPVLFDGDEPRWAYDAKVSFDRSEIEAIEAYGAAWQKDRAMVVAELLAGRLTLAVETVTRTVVRLRGMSAAEAAAHQTPRNTDGRVS